MSRIRVKSEKVLKSSPEAIYNVVSDYKEKHAQLLTPNFQDYKVEKGGLGSGTVVNFRLRAGGRERPYRMQVDEPVKGQVLRESDTNSSLVTVWTLSPLDHGERTRVRITTEWDGGRGVGGFFERTFAPMGMRRIYSRILSTLAQTAHGEHENGNALASQKRKKTPVNFALSLLTLGGIIAIGYSLYLRRIKASGR